VGAATEGGKVEHARVNLMTADPVRVDRIVRYVEDEARPRVEDEPGSLGMALFVHRDWGVLVIESFWVSGEAMWDSEQATAPLRKEAIHHGVATVSVERHELASSVRAERPVTAQASG
jgi:hypothetical protein